MPAPPSRDAASLPALADRCVQCGLCLPHCPTYRLDASEAESPRGRIAYVRAVATGLMPATSAGDRHLDHCLGCLRCEEACPAGVEYGDLLRLARAEQVKRRPLPIGRRLRLGLLARPRLLAGLLRIYRLAYPWLPASGRNLPRPPGQLRLLQGSSTFRDDRVREVAIFVGCVADAYEIPVRSALQRCLQHAGVRLTPVADQTCCGTAAAHAGDTAMAESLAETNRRAFASHPTLLCLASGCRDVLRTSLAGTSEVVDAFAFLHGLGERLRFRSGEARRVALHLPCSQRGDPASTAALRALLARVPGLDVIELPDTGCCGAAGLHMLDEPDRAARLRQPLLATLADSGATELLSANIGCRLHLGNGTRMAIRHPVELLAEYLA